MTDYNKQAQDFIDKSGITIIKTFTGFRPHFTGETMKRDTYLITIERKDKSNSDRNFSFSFGDSIENAELRRKDKRFCNMYGSLKQRYLERYKEIKAWPTDYDILACISSESYQYDTLQDFCDNMGYDTDSRKALDIYLTCQEHATNINRFFSSDELEQLRDIQ